MTRQASVLSMLLLGVAVLSHTRLYQALPVQNGEALVNFPRSLGQWQTVLEYPATAREIELLETRNILTRIYRDGGGREVSMVLVYDASANRKMAHPQEICLTADGLQGISKTSTPLGRSGIEAERLLMQRDAGRVLYYYWYKAGDAQSGNYLKTQWRLAWSTLAGHSGGTALIRISTPVAAGAEERGDELLQEFGAALLPEVQRFLP